MRRITAPKERIRPAHTVTPQAAAQSTPKRIRFLLSTLILIRGSRPAFFSLPSRFSSVKKAMNPAESSAVTAPRAICIVPLHSIQWPVSQPRGGIRDAMNTGQKFRSPRNVPRSTKG